MTDRALVSIIIPALNEEEALEHTLRTVRGQPEPFDIVVVDGGSTDNTVECARSKGASVLRAPRGRATQMNRGAAAADGDILLFLHADTHLPPHALAHIRDVVDQPSTVAGTFRLQFDPLTPLLRFYSWCTRVPWIRLCFGDRGLFVTWSAFQAVGGYPDWSLFEDLEFAARLNDYGRFHFLNEAVTTSARRFQQNGVFIQQLRNAYLWMHYIAGGNPEHVAHLYPYGDQRDEQRSSTVSK